jgi:hypothetical protein
MLHHQSILAADALSLIYGGKPSMTRQQVNVVAWNALPELLTRLLA